MLKILNPEFVIKNFILYDYEHSGKNTLYLCTYLRQEVEKKVKAFC
jgi:hypothetical protein